MKKLSLAVNANTASQMQSASLAREVAAYGEFPDAIFDLTEIHLTRDGVRVVARAFRNAEATEPLLNADPIVLDMTWEELRATPGTPALEAAIRDAAWALLMSHPKMQRDGQSIFAGGALIEV
jgi:hypothetical protein